MFAPLAHASSSLENLCEDQSQQDKTKKKREGLRSAADRRRNCPIRAAKVTQVFKCLEAA